MAHAYRSLLCDPMARPRFKSGSSKKPFLNIPVEVLKSAACQGLRPSAFRILCFIAAQYRGGNNGDFSIAHPVMAEFGMRSRRAVRAAVDDLEERGLITMTRQGGRNQCNLYAVTWFGIHYCKGKLEVRENPVPSNEWKSWEPAKSF